MLVSRGTMQDANSSEIKVICPARCLQWTLNFFAVDQISSSDCYRLSGSACIAWHSSTMRLLVPHERQNFKKRFRRLGVLPHLIQEQTLVNGDEFARVSCNILCSFVVRSYNRAWRHRYSAQQRNLPARALLFIFIHLIRNPCHISR